MGIRQNGFPHLEPSSNQIGDGDVEKGVTLLTPVPGSAPSKTDLNDVVRSQCGDVEAMSSPINQVVRSSSGTCADVPPSTDAEAMVPPSTRMRAQPVSQPHTDIGDVDALEPTNDCI